MVPGPALSALLAGLDHSMLTDATAVEVLRASWRQVSHAYAQYLTAMAEVGRRSDPAWATCEIEAALTFTARRADYEHTFAHTVVRRLPLVLDALRSGALDHHKARVFAEYLADLTDAQIAVICGRLLPRAPGWTTGQLAHRLLREVSAVDHHHTRRRYQNAVVERGVSGFLAPDGTATITAHGLTPSEAAAAADRLDALATAVRRAGHPGTIHQVRADLFVRLLDGRYNGFTTDQIVAAMLADNPAGPEGERPGPGPTRGDDRCTPGSGVPGGGGPVSSGPESRGPVSSGPVSRGPVSSGPESRGPVSSGPESRGPVSSGPESRGPEGRGPGSSDSGHAPDTGPAAAQPAQARPEGVRHGIEVRIALTTLLGWDDHAAELPGWGPIPADEARLLVSRQHAAEWCFAITDTEGYLLHGALIRTRPRTASTIECRRGAVEIHVPETRLRDLADSPDIPPEWASFVADLARRHTAWQARPGDPDACLDEHPRSRFPHLGLRRHIRLRDRTCVAPGCRRPARSADQDHTRDHVRGGGTVRANLAPLCERHHLMKHEGGWALTQPEPGRFVWCSPLRQTYRTRGDPIAPDLPDPLPRNDNDADVAHDGRTYDGPILPRGPDPPIPPRQTEQTSTVDNGPPPF
jgi:hypothetical protein